MVSLRSGSTTDAHNAEANGLPEVSSRRTSRQKAKQAAALPPAQVAAAGKGASSATRTGRRNGAKGPLPAIAELPQAGTPAAAAQALRSMEAPAAVHLERQPSDTPARHTRARSRQQEQAAAGGPLLPAPQVTAARGVPGTARKPARSRLADSSRAAEAAGPSLRVQGELPVSVRDANKAETSGDSQAALEEGGAAAASGSISEEHGGEPAEALPDQPEGGTGVVWTTSEEEVEEEAEDDSDSGSEEEEEGREGLGRMAESMLAALGSLGHGPAGAGRVAGAERARAAATRTSRGGAGPSGAGPLRTEAGEQPDLAQMHWEPALQLPPPVGSAEASQGPAALAKAELVAGKQLTAPPRDAQRRAREARKAAPDTAGRSWFDLPATQITDEVKRELRLLRLRGAMDPKRFYKSFDTSNFPKYFQFGTVVEGAADYYAGRMTKRERKRTLTEELLADAQLKQTRKKRFGALQADKQRWSHKKQRRVGYERKKVYKRPRH